MHTHPMFRFLLLISLITGCVLLAFRYLLPLLLPFITAYVLMRLLLPIIQFLRKQWHLPRQFAYGITLSAFFLIVLSSLLLFGKYLIRQCQLLCANAPIYGQIGCQTIQTCCNRICLTIDQYLRLKQGSTLTFLSTKLQAVSDRSAEQFYEMAGQTAVHCIGGSMQLVMFLAITAISMVILCKDMEPLHQAYRKNRFFSAIHRVMHTMRTTGLTYLRTQCIILLSNWGLCSIGLCLIRNPYFILIGLAIAFIDALPVVGSGCILIPWSLYFVFQQQFYPAAVLLTTYLATLFTREFLEARLLGGGLGMLSFFTLAAIYVGIKLYGICGIFLGPFAIVLIRAIYQVWTEQEDLRQLPQKD